MKKINLQNLKEKFSFYRKQKKFQLSVLDWVPHFDWYVLLVLLCVFLITAAAMTFNVYQKISEQIDQGPDSITLEKDYINFDEVQDLVAEYEIRKNRLNTLR